MLNDTGQIILRNLINSDFESYRSWHNLSFKWVAFNGSYFPLKSKAVLDNEISGLILNQDLSINSRMVISNRITNELIGTVSWYWQSEATKWMSVGIAIYDDIFWGKNIGFEALGLWTDLLFLEFPEIVKLDIRTWSGNKSMIKLAEKPGYKLEAVFRMARKVDGKYYDSIGWHTKRRMAHKMP